MLESLARESKDIKNYTLLGRSEDGERYIITTGSLLHKFVKVNEKRYSNLHVITRVNPREGSCEISILADDEDGIPLELYPHQRRPSSEALQAHIDAWERIKALYCR